jgi:hypothetical protein
MSHSRLADQIETATASLRDDCIRTAQRTDSLTLGRRQGPKTRDHGSMAPMSSRGKYSRCATKSSALLPTGVLERISSVNRWPSAAAELRWAYGISQAETSDTSAVAIDPQEDEPLEEHPDFGHCGWTL